jgi:ATP-binding cassette subfamily B protein
MRKKEIVRQHDLQDCGVCSLLSVIKHYDGYISLEQLRYDTSTSIEGTTAYHLIEAAKGYGFDAYGLKLDSIEELKNCIFPVIAHVQTNNLNHFVVIYKITKDKIIVMDPAVGKESVTIPIFQKKWTKNVIVLYPKYPLPNIKQNNILKQFISYILKKEKGKIIKFIFLSAFFTFVTLITSFYFKIGLNILEDYEDSNVLKLIFLSFIILFLIKFFLYYLRNYFKIILDKNIDGYLYKHFLNHLFSLPNYFIKNRTTGEIMTRMNELKNFKFVFSEIVIILCIDLPITISVSIILYNINSLLFLIAFILMVIYFLYGFIISKILYKKVWRTNELEVQFNSTIIENIDMYTSIKNLNIGHQIDKKLEIKLFKYLTSFFKLNSCVLNFDTWCFILEETIHFSVLSVGLFEILNNNISLIDLVTFETLLSYFITPIKNCINLLPSYYSLKINMHKLSEFYNVLEEETTKGYEEFISGDITINNLCFAYNNFHPIFKNFNLFIKENSFVLFQGKSGCGKSTLCQMLCRMVENKENNIKIGDIYLNDYSLDTIRKNITYVGQRENLIQDTLENNILLDRNVSEEKLKKVKNICKLDDIVLNKPLRYETYLFKDSINFSGGEKQRIILARALLNDFKILILDEALSEVNTDLETEIINNLKKYYKDKTIIYVSHKSYQNCFDKIYKFGEIYERRT